MLSEQHEDRRNNTILSNDKNAELAHSLAASGKFDAAETLVKSTEAINKSAVNSNIGFTPQQGKVGADTVRKSAINGRLQYEYEQANAEKKGEDYLKSLAKRPDWIADKDYETATQSIRSYVSNQESLKSNYEQLTLSQFQEKIATNASSITGTELQSTLDKLSPINASKLNLAYISGVKSQMKEKEEQTSLITHWEDSREQANASDKVKNAAFNGKVSYALKNDPGLSLDKAENQVAASAGGSIPVFTTSLKNGLWGGDPARMVSAARQVDDLQSNGNGHALKGLSDQDLAIASDIKHNFNPADPTSAARIVTDNKQNQDSQVRKDSEAAFANNLYDNTRKNGVTSDDYVLNTFGMQGSSIIHPFNTGFDSPWMRSHYASDILSNWRTNFINSGRDDARAKDMTQDYIKNNYGKTSINGSSEWTLHPIEKACGLPEGEGLSAINNDIVRQISDPISKLKTAYEENKSNTYWSIEKGKVETPGYRRDTTIKTQDSKLQFIKHTRNGNATDTETYPLRLVGNNFNWDLNVETDKGPMSIFLAAPEIGVHTYTPDTKWINDEYLKKGHYENFPTEQYTQTLKKIFNPSEENH